MSLITDSLNSSLSDLLPLAVLPRNLLALYKPIWLDITRLGAVSDLTAQAWPVWNTPSALTIWTKLNEQLHSSGNFELWGEYHWNQGRDNSGGGGGE